jgi:hypothetical protein
LSVDGVAKVSSVAVTALHGQMRAQRNLVTVMLASGAHTTGVAFLNDQCGGTGQNADPCTPTTDRNLYIEAVLLDGQPIAGATAMLSAGTTIIKFTVP